MKKILSTHDAAHELSSNKNNGFTYQGATALAEYLEQLEESTGEDIEFDEIAIRCEYAEYESALEAANDCGFKPDEDEDEQEESALSWLEKHTIVIPFRDGVIIATSF